jgi:hypothetical protein
MGFSIFSFTPNKYSNNSAELHRHDVAVGDERLVVEATRELRRQGHRIVDVVQNDAKPARERRERRR